ncbi:MAG: sugar ABC transporter ATP-binding protein [Planctomycetia bacterium]|nr:sugar ABC transporter ATP-binding protein [Planctomycetia bacterium]
MSADGSLLAVSGLSKSYTVPVLRDVHFDLLPGEVHALVGENGAGKSTLCRIITGRVRPDAGHVTLRGKLFAPPNPRVAEDAGVRMVMQELNLIGNLSIAENIFLNRLPGRWGWIDYRRLHDDARRVMSLVGLDRYEPARLVHTLGVGHRQLVEIAAALSRRCAVLILDEPTAALSDTETDLLFRQLDDLRAAGTGIIYISHRMEEMQRIADRITVLRDGCMVATHPARAVAIADIVRQMVGRDLDAVARSQERQRGGLALRVNGLTRGQAVRDVSFEAYRGEILGFAGLMGAGRTETMRLIFGADPLDRGDLYLHGAGTPTRIRSPRDAVRHGIALLTEDRKAEGLLLPLPIRANIGLARMPALSSGRTWLNAEKERENTAHFVRDLSVNCRSTEQPVGQLSGGNQQKVVLAKWLFRDCEILIFDEPTRGIDVGAKFEIYRLLEDLAGRGKAVLVVSSDLKELLTICDRIAVLSLGRLAATFERGQWSEHTILQAALSGHASTPS